MARLLFVTQTAHPWGGVEAWLEYISAALADEHEVTIGLVRGRRFHDPNRYRAARRLRVPTIDISAPTGTTEGRVRAVMRAVTKTAAGVVVPVNIADTLEAVRRLKNGGRDVRLLYPLHGLGSEYFTDVRAFRGVIDFAAGANRLAERGLIAVAGLDRDRVAYASCGVAPASSRPSFESLPHLRLVYAGRLTQMQKRVLDLVPLCRELARRNIDYELDIAGDGEELPYLRSTLADAPATFHGLLSREELYERIYPGAAAMLLLAEWETGPIAAWEAMRNGATLVTTAYRGLHAEGRLVHGENALVAEVGNVAALADCVQKLAIDAPLLERLRCAAFETAERDCSIERSVALWRETFARCVELPRTMDTRPGPLPKPFSRLDRLAGPRVAESIRAALGRGMFHNEPGGEWPHTFHAPDPKIDAAIAQLDH